MYQIQEQQISIGNALTIILISCNVPAQNYFFNADNLTLHYSVYVMTT